MNLIKILVVGLVTIASSRPVWAHHPAHYSQLRVSVGIAAPLHQSHYRHHHRVIYYPYIYSWPYYAPVVIYPVTSYAIPAGMDTVYPVTEVQQRFANNINDYRPNNTGNDWLYCRQPDGFYPAIKSCPSGWQHVPAQVPR